MYFFIVYSEMDQFLQDLDDDVESMQSTIYYLQNELIKYKTAAAQNISYTETKDSVFISKESDTGFKDDFNATEPMPSASSSEVPTKFIRTIHHDNNQLYKTYSAMDLKYMKDTMGGNSSKVNELGEIFETEDHYERIHKVHKCKHRSDGNRSEEKRKKAERRHSKEGRWCFKKMKCDGPTITEIRSDTEDTK